MAAGTKGDVINMQDSRQAVVEEYNRLAHRYDGRWGFYIRATTEATARRIQLQPGEKLLDIGCGTGALLNLLAAQHNAVNLVGIDPSPEMLAVARQKLPTVQFELGFAERLPFADNCFDVVASNSAFHYFQAPDAALREIRRVLRPGGRVVLTDWCDDYLSCRLCDRWLRWTDPAHARIYRADQCRQFLERSGLASITVSRYRINWLWGLMTATARKPALQAPVPSSGL